MFRAFDLKAKACLFVMVAGLACLQSESTSAQIARPRIQPSPYTPGALPSLIDPATGQVRDLTPPRVEAPLFAPVEPPYTPPPPIYLSGGLAGPAPDWVAKPLPDDYSRYYPAYARQLDQPGRAVIDCVITADGKLERCSVRSETPEEYGFGQSALRLSRLFRAGVVDRRGRSLVGTIITVPIIFQLPAPLPN